MTRGDAHLWAAQRVIEQRGRTKLAPGEGIVDLPIETAIGQERARVGKSSLGRFDRPIRRKANDGGQRLICPVSSFCTREL